MKKRAHEGIELEAAKNRMKLDQAKEWLHVKKLMKKEEIFQACCEDEFAIAKQEEEEMLEACKQDGIFPDSPNDRRFKVPESILHHPFIALSFLFSEGFPTCCE